MTDLLVNMAGLALMAGIIYWFWLAKTPPDKTSQSEE